jgi:hypothetical protein
MFINVTGITHRFLFMKQVGLSTYWKFSLKKQKQTFSQQYSGNLKKGRKKEI